MAGPPLEGGAERYPAELVAGLPPERLSLEYVPHLDAFNQGVSRTLAHVASDPAGWAGLGAAKLAHAWRGASAGLGGHGLPAGGSGTRRPVDLVVNDGLLGTLWSLAVLAAAISGLVLARREKALTPWVLLLVGRFAQLRRLCGYARQGALARPRCRSWWRSRWPGSPRRASGAGPSPSAWGSWRSCSCSSSSARTAAWRSPWTAPRSGRRRGRGRRGRDPLRLNDDRAALDDGAHGEVGAEGHEVRAGAGAERADLRPRGRSRGRECATPWRARP